MATLFDTFSDAEWYDMNREVFDQNETSNLLELDLLTGADPVDSANSDYLESLRLKALEEANKPSSLGKPSLANPSSGFPFSDFATSLIPGYNAVRGASRVLDDPRKFAGELGSSFASAAPSFLRGATSGSSLALSPPPLSAPVNADQRVNAEGVFGDDLVTADMIDIDTESLPDLGSVDLAPKVDPAAVLAKDRDRQVRGRYGELMDKISGKVPGQEGSVSDIRELLALAEMEGRLPEQKHKREQKIKKQRERLSRPKKKISYSKNPDGTITATLPDGTTQKRSARYEYQLQNFNEDVDRFNKTVKDSRYLKDIRKRYNSAFRDGNLSELNKINNELAELGDDLATDSPVSFYKDKLKRAIPVIQERVQAQQAVKDLQSQNKILEKEVRDLENKATSGDFEKDQAKLNRAKELRAQIEKNKKIAKDIPNQTMEGKSKARKKMVKIVAKNRKALEGKNDLDILSDREIEHLERSSNLDKDYDEMISRKKAQIASDKKRLESEAPTVAGAVGSHLLDKVGGSVGKAFSSVAPDVLRGAFPGYDSMQEGFNTLKGIYDFATTRIR